MLDSDFNICTRTFQWTFMGILNLKHDWMVFSKFNQISEVAAIAEWWTVSWSRRYSGFKDRVDTKNLFSSHIGVAEFRKAINDVGLRC